MVHHSDALTRESGDAALAEAVVSSDHEVLGGRLRALLDYAVALTVDPHAVGVTRWSDCSGRACPPGT